MNRDYILQAFKITSPVLFGYLAIGIPFGLMLVEAGYPWWMAPLMSISMYAGAGQYMAIGLFAAGASLPVIFTTQILLNCRHIVYGLSLIKPFKKTGKIKPYLIFALTDETYALMSSTPLPPHANPSIFYGLIAFFDHSYWIIGGIIGSLTGLFIPSQYLEGIDFALTLLFVVLLIDQIKTTKNLIAPIIGIFVSLLALLFCQSDNMLILSLSLGLTTLIILKKPIEKLEQKGILQCH